MVATEIAFFPLKPGIECQDVTTKSGELFTTALKQIISQNGCQSIFWGHQVDKLDVLTLFINWDSIGHHKKFIDSGTYAPFVEKMMSLAAGAPSAFHAHLTPFPPLEVVTGRSPMVTEAVMLYFPSDYSSTNQDAFHRTMSVTFRGAFEPKPDGFTGFASGWAVEGQDIPGGRGKGKVYIFFIGWETVEKHVQFMQSAVFKEHMHLITEARDLQGYELVYINVREGPEKAGGYPA